MEAVATGTATRVTNVSRMATGADQTPGRPKEDNLTLMKVTKTTIRSKVGKWCNDRRIQLFTNETISFYEG